MDLGNNTTQIIIALFALFAGIALTISIRTKIKKNSKDTNLKNVKAGGDIVFGDKKTSIKK